MSEADRGQPAGVRAAGGRPVVVGADGSPGSARAVVWAARDAVRRRRPLRLVTVLPAHGVYSEFLATDAAAEARRAAPDVVASTLVLDGDPVDALLEAGRDAELLVVGHRGRRALAGLFLGSVSGAVAERSVCPTVVVRGARPASLHDPVIVGVDGTPAGEAAVGFAFAAADRDGVPLVAVHVWHDEPDDPEWSSPFEVDPASVPDIPESELLAERLAGWGGRYPDVDVVRFLPRGRPAHALVEQSARARLLVVGSRERHGLGRIVGSVGGAVLRQAHCPVAVVPPAAAAAAAGTDTGSGAGRP